MDSDCFSFHSGNKDKRHYTKKKKKTCEKQKKFTHRIALLPS